MPEPLPNLTPFKILERQKGNLVPYGPCIEFASVTEATAYIQNVSAGNWSFVSFITVIFNMDDGTYHGVYHNGQKLPARFFLYRGQKLLASGDDEKSMIAEACHYSRQSPKPVTLQDEVHGWRHTYVDGREVFPRT